MTNINKNILKLESEKTDIDNDLIANLYKEAAIYNQTMHKDFEDIVNFHNKMLINKIEFSKKSLAHKNKIILDTTSKRTELIQDYELIKQATDDKIFSELNELNDNLLKESNELKIIKNAYNKIDEIEIIIKDDTTELEEIINTIDQRKKVIQDNINIFNKYFTEYTKILYHDEYYISLGDDISKPFEVNTKYNPGDGKKKAVITAFDLAYSSFLLESKLGYPMFIAEDQMELIDLKQLQELFNISNNINSQLIIPVLSSKINQIDGLKEHEILILSEEDRFFRF